MSNNAGERETRLLDVAGQQSTKYFVEYEENLSDTTSQSSDGCTLYRTLARQVIGTPSRYKDIRQTVQQFYLRVYANASHPLHDEFVQQDSAFNRTSKYRLFAVLEAPDLDTNEHLLWVIAYALKVQIAVYGKLAQGQLLEDPALSVGPDLRRICRVLQLKLPTKNGEGMPYHFDSILPDESGKALIEYLQEQRQRTAQDPSTLQVKQLSWAWRDKSEYEIDWFAYNEYDPASKESDLKNTTKDDRFDTFVVTVNDSKHVGAALDLFRGALLLAPYQGRWTRHSENQEEGFMLPHCSVYAEFVKLSREDATGSDFDLKHGVDTGKLEELCSVLTFAIGRHFFLVFNIVHMMETADQYTVPALSLLFRETVFNPRLLKLWWNPQSDILVLNNTIAHLYQGTIRQPYIHTTWYHHDQYEIKGAFRLHSEHFAGSRPSDLEFPKEDTPCELHEVGHDEQGTACTCRLGNIDISYVIGRFCAMHGLEGTGGRSAWTFHRDRFNYGDLLRAMLYHDRLLPIMSYLKDQPGRSGDKAQFYQGMGKPRMELDSNVMGYNLGDVAGQNIVLEFLLSSDDHDLIYESLCSYNYFSRSIDYSIGVPVRQRTSQLGRVGNVQLFEDNPKSYMDKAIHSNGPRARPASQRELITMGIRFMTAEELQERGFDPAPTPLTKDELEALDVSWKSSEELAALGYCSTLSTSWNDWYTEATHQCAEEAATVSADRPEPTPKTMWELANMGLANRTEEELEEFGYVLARSDDRRMPQIGVPSANLYTTGSLAPWEHDRRVGLMRSQGHVPLSSSDYESGGGYSYPASLFREAIKRGRERVLRLLHDPTRHWVPETCVERAPPVYEDPVVRAGATHSEALIDLLKSTHAALASAPLGFGAAAGTIYGLPKWLGRIPGQDLDQARNLFDAFQQPSAQIAATLGKKFPLPNRRAWFEGKMPAKDVLLQKTCDSQAYSEDIWAAARSAKEAARKAIAEESEMNEEEGLPLSLDPQDFFDLEGREYRRRMERASAWNRLPLRPLLDTNSDGTWRSKATIQLEVLLEQASDDDEGEWQLPKKTFPDPNKQPKAGSEAGNGWGDETASGWGDAGSGWGDAGGDGSTETSNYKSRVLDWSGDDEEEDHWDDSIGSCQEDQQANDEPDQQIQEENAVDQQSPVPWESQKWKYTETGALKGWTELFGYCDDNVTMDE